MMLNINIRMRGWNLASNVGIKAISIGLGEYKRADKILLISLLPFFNIGRVSYSFVLTP